MSSKQLATHSRKKLKIILAITFVGCAFFYLLTVQAPSRNEPESPMTSAATQHKQETTGQPEVKYGLPARLKIPKINVDAVVEHIGLTSEGDMQEPTTLQSVGWYKFGPRPGNTGSAVVAGHYGLRNKDVSVFNKLHTLSKGDLVQIEDEKGAVAIFIVRELKIYDKNAAAPEVFGSSDGKAHLNLVTCTGTWQEAHKTYSERLVVFAESR